MRFEHKSVFCNDDLCGYTIFDNYTQKPIKFYARSDGTLVFEDEDLADFLSEALNLGVKESGWEPTSQSELLKLNGWEIECESPFEIRHEDGSFASGQAADMVIESLRYGMTGE